MTAELPDVKELKKARTQARGNVTRCSTVITQIQTLLPRMETGSLEDRTARKMLAEFEESRATAIAIRDELEVITMVEEAAL